MSNSFLKFQRKLFFDSYKAIKKAPNSSGLKILFKNRWITLQREKFIAINCNKEVG
jgi:hypothetical protein